MNLPNYDDSKNLFRTLLVAALVQRRVLVATSLGW